MKARRSPVRGHGRPQQDGPRRQGRRWPSGWAPPAIPPAVAVENVSAGYHTLAEAFSGWRDSPPHRANMLKSGVTKLGIAASYAPNTKYKVFWTLILGVNGAKIQISLAHKLGVILARSRRLTPPRTAATVRRHCSLIDGSPWIVPNSAPATTPAKAQRVLVLQGGGALGSYQAGAYQALCHRISSRNGSPASRSAPSMPPSSPATSPTSASIG